jgi:hypothetical protein
MSGQDKARPLTVKLTAEQHADLLALLQKAKHGGEPRPCADCALHHDDDACPHPGTERTYAHGGCPGMRKLPPGHKVHGLAVAFAQARWT